MSAMPPAEQYSTWLLLETMLEREQRWTEVAPVESGSRPRRMLWREPLLVVMAFAAGMIILATSQNIKGHAKNAENAILPALPALPKEALTEAEIKRWVVKPGQSVPEIVRPPLGSNISIEGYQSSEMELTWLTGDIAKGTLCDHARKPAITAKAQTWVEYSSQRGAWAPNQRPAPKPTPQQAKVLSHFLVQGHPEPIEPLYGVARHPFGVPTCAKNATGHSADLMDITYLVIHNDCGRQQRPQPKPKPRVLLFDMGASTGFNQIPNGVPATVHNGNGGGPSVPLFYRLYKDRCLEPDAIFCWELNKVITSSDWWGV